MQWQPNFGDKRKCAQPRYGVYVVIPDAEKQNCPIQAPNGAWFLPGVGEEKLKSWR